jgi:hypothetical protein
VKYVSWGGIYLHPALNGLTKLHQLYSTQHKTSSALDGGILFDIVLLSDTTQILGAAYLKGVLCQGVSESFKTNR